MAMKHSGVRNARNVRMMGITGLWGIAVMTACIGTVSHAATVPPADARDKLQSLYNEVDLLIRNRKADLDDVRRQEKEAQFLQMYKRIPRTKDSKGILKSLHASAREHGVKIGEVVILESARRINRFPNHSIPTLSASASCRIRSRPPSNSSSRLQEHATRSGRGRRAGMPTTGDSSYRLKRFHRPARGKSGLYEARASTFVTYTSRS